MKDDCVLCGRDATGGWTRPVYGGHRLCERCVRNLVSRFNAFFGVLCSWTDNGLELRWNEVKGILDHIKIDQVGKVPYIVADQEYYGREAIVDTAVTEGP